jgi:IS4 transposase
MLPAPFQTFVQRTPIAVLARASLESLFQPAELDDLFRQTARSQYQHQLLFSHLVDLMLTVVLRQQPSVHAAYRYLRAEGRLCVSPGAVYEKRARMELGVSAALVRHSAQRAAPVIAHLKAGEPSWLPGWRVRILDGSHLAATEHRLQELRPTWAGALPGAVLAVLDQQTQLITDVFLTPDGHAQERSLLDDILRIAEARDVWIADRNFCTLKFLFGLDQAKAAFVIRQHGTVKGRLLGKRRLVGRSATGMVYEQQLELAYEGQVLRVRRVTVELDAPTTGGDTALHILTNLKVEEADACAVAEMYRQRWTIEGRFYEVTQTLECEPQTLGYPKAALFAFCLALLASNAVALLKAALRSVHGGERVAALSVYYLTLEIRQTYRGMLIALPEAAWEFLRELSAAALAQVLREVASQVDLARYAKAKRGPKKKPPPRGRYINGKHIATQQLLESRKE